MGLHKQRAHKDDPIAWLHTVGVPLPDRSCFRSLSHCFKANSAREIAGTKATNRTTTSPYEQATHIKPPSTTATTPVSPATAHSSRTENQTATPTKYDAQAASLPPKATASLTLH
jgi:hypothetical protein